jgi:hypothetical protein
MRVSLLISDLVHFGPAPVRELAQGSQEGGYCRGRSAAGDQQTILCRNTWTTSVAINMPDCRRSDSIRRQDRIERVYLAGPVLVRLSGGVDRSVADGIRDVVVALGKALAGHAR